MKRVAVICEEKTEYTLDVIAEVYRPRGVDVYWRRELTWLDVFKIYRNHQIVVVNGYAGWDYWLGFILNAIFFKRILGVDSDSQPEVPRAHLRRAAKRILLSWLYRHAWCWGLAGGTGVHRKAFSMYGMPEKRIVLNPMVSRKNVEAVEPDKHDKFRFGYVGRLVKHKQVEGILQAWQETGIADSEMVVVGDGAERTALEQKFPNVRFTGRLSGRELAREMAALDCLVLWSRYEPWGLVVNEALSMGIPVIVSDKVGAKEDLVMGKGTGVIVPCDDRLALGGAMRQMVREAATMRENCLRVAGEWNMAFYAQCWDEWISKVL